MIGASPAAWAAFVDLGLTADLLPVVADTSTPIAAYSKLHSLGKTPSLIDSEGSAYGLARWTQRQSTEADVQRWSKDQRLGISLQTRTARAIDVDINDTAVSDAIQEALGLDLPMRERANKARKLFLFRYAEPMTKRVIPVGDGLIEFLGDGQQAIVAGTHPSGERYSWGGKDAPDTIPELTTEQLEALWERLVLCFATGPVRIAHARREGAGGDLATTDDVVDYLIEHWETYDAGSSGQIFAKCPFAGGHSTDTGPTSTAYFPAGTGGYAQGHWSCLHASCSGRADQEFLDAVGYSAHQFADLAGAVVPAPHDVGDGGGAAELPALQLVRDKQGRIEPSADNMVKLCVRPDQIKKRLAFDEFRDELVWAPPSDARGAEQWRAFSDVDYTDVQIELERRGVKPMSMDGLRRAIKRAAFERHMDTAKEWLGRLQWDGIERLESFCIAGWGWSATPYSMAVGRYIWTAMAGRVLEPGCQADMAPILVGPQGAGKTSAIKAMVPSDEHYVSIPLDDHDDNTSRRLRGKLVGELEELRGLNSRAIEVIKAWITRTSEGWIPKYMEFEATFKRRLVFIGSTNEDEFLADPTGERRWLPGRCGDLDIEWIKTHRDQLWAEGAVKFLASGVDWEDAQTLGREQHGEFKVSDSWAGSVARWLIEPNIAGVTPADGGSVQLGEVLAGAVGIAVGSQDRAKEMRMAKVLKELGWIRKRLPADAAGRRAWGYVKEEK